MRFGWALGRFGRHALKKAHEAAGMQRAILRGFGTGEKGDFFTMRTACFHQKARFWIDRFPDEILGSFKIERRIKFDGLFHKRRPNRKGNPGS